MDAAVSRLGELPGSPFSPDERVVALTFDDGPGSGTRDVLDALGEFDVPATFFVVGQACEAHRADLERIVESGHTIGCHSWSHARLSSLTDEDVRSEYARTAGLVGAMTGQTVSFARPTYRKADAPRLARLLEPLGWRAVVTWSVDPQDWRPRPAGEIAASVVDALHPGAIVLLHDGGGDRRATVASLPEIVASGRALGYRFVAL